MHGLGDGGVERQLPQDGSTHVAVGQRPCKTAFGIRDDQDLERRRVEACDGIEKRQVFPYDRVLPARTHRSTETGRS